MMATQIFGGWKRITIKPVMIYQEGERPVLAHRVTFTAYNPHTAPREFTFDTFREASDFAHGEAGTLLHGYTVPSPRRVIIVG